jgi:hypothetical protein
MKEMIFDRCPKMTCPVYFSIRDFATDEGGIKVEY